MHTADEVGRPKPGSKMLQRADERRSARSKVLMKGAIECDGIRVPVRVINLSEHGVLVTGETLPPEDKPVTFRCSGRDAAGWMAWVRPPQAGINFDALVKSKSVVAPKTESAANMITKDTRKLDFRRPGFRGNQMSAEERAIVEAWKREQLEAEAGDAKVTANRADRPQ